VVIALAVKSLPAGQRLKGIIFGQGFAIILRVLLTFFCSQLLQIEMIKFIGGILILWIAVKLLIEGVNPVGNHRKPSPSGRPYGLSSLRTSACPWIMCWPLPRLQRESLPSDFWLGAQYSTDRSLRVIFCRD